MPSQIFRNIFLFTIISFVERGINYIISLVLSFYLVPEELGKLTYVLTIQAYMYPLILCYTNGANLLHYSKKNDGLNYFFNSNIVNIISFIIVGILANTVVFFLDRSLMTVLLSLLIISLFDAIRLNFLSYNQAITNIKNYAVVAVIFVVLNLFFTFYLLSKYNNNYLQRINAMLISNVVTLFLVAYLLNFKVAVKKQKQDINNVLSYGLPLLPHAFGLITIESMNRYFLDIYTTKHELGLYSFAFTLAAPIGILNTAFGTAWAPQMYKLIHQNDEQSKHKIVNISALYITAILLSCISLSLLSSFIIHNFFPERYYDSIKYLKILPFYYFMQAVYIIFSAILFFFNKNKYFILFAFVNIISSLVINYLLFSHFAEKGAAYASIIGMSIFAILVSIVSHKIYPLPWLNLNLFQLLKKK